MKRAPVLLALLLGLPSGQAQDESEHPVSIKARSTVVLVDAFVRDGKGRPVPGLTASDFELDEDGVPQTITYVQDFTPKQEQPEAPTGAVAESPSSSDQDLIQLAGSSGPNQALQGSFTAILVDRMSQTSRYYVSDALRQYISEIAEPNAHVGVFAIDFTLRTLQYFTGDRQLLEQAVDRVGTLVTSRLTPDPTLDSALQDQASQVTGGGLPAAEAGPDAASRQAQEIMNNSFSLLQRKYAGYATTSALLAMIHSMQILPGRKSIVFFSEGLSLPPAVVARFWSVVNAANRANIGVYTIDAMGLRLVSTAPRGITSSWPMTLDGGADGLSYQPMMGTFEGMEEQLRSDPFYNLRQLADQTGGIFIHDTNDLGGGLRKVDQDLHSYYLLAYTPKNGDFDGRFRQIEVRVKRPGCDVRYRKGYYAVDANFDEPLLEYEAPAVAVLQKGETPETLPLHASVLSFPKPADRGFVTVLADVAQGNLRYREGAEGTEVSNFSIVVLARDASGKVVRKTSQQYLLSRKAGTPPGGDSILFYRELELPPGTYDVEIAGFDAVSGHAGVQRRRLVLKDLDPALPGLSSLMIVQAAETISEKERAAVTPFHYDNLLLYPKLGDRLSKTRNREVMLFFTVYPTPTTGHEATIDVFRFGRKVGKSVIDLPSANSDGEIEYARAIGIEDFAPGTYTLRVSIPAGDRVVMRSMRFLLTP